MTQTEVFNQFENSNPSSTVCVITHFAWGIIVLKGLK